MDFYTAFAKDYNIHVSFKHKKKRETAFWRKIWTQYHVKSILDCACGTGQHLLLFSQMGYDVKGSDVNEAMLQITQKRLNKHKVKTSVIQCDFRELTTKFHEPFDAIVNLGNSLPYLESDAEFQKTFQDARALLNPNGIYVINIRNYDKLMRERPRSLVISRRINHAFVYFFEYLEKSVRFNVIHLRFFPHQFHVYPPTEYFPLYFDKLQSLLTESGFYIIQCYQSLSEKSFDKSTSDSYTLICQKIN